MSEPTRPSTGSKVGCFVVLAVVIALAGGGVVWLVNALHAPRHQSAASISDLQDLCSGRPIPQAPAYVPGSGPHPIAVFANDRDNVSGSGGSQFTFAGRDADGKLFNPSNAGSVQLVACTDRTDDGPKVSACNFKETSGPMHKSTLEITVYEARTGKQVREPITVVGEDTKCPFFVTYRGKEPIVFSTPSSQQFVAALTPLVSG